MSQTNKPLPEDDQNRESQKEKSEEIQDPPQSFDAIDEARRKANEVLSSTNNVKNNSEDRLLSFDDLDDENVELSLGTDGGEDKVDVDHDDDHSISLGGSDGGNDFGWSDNDEDVELSLGTDEDEDEEDVDHDDANHQSKDEAPEDRLLTPDDLYEEDADDDPIVLSNEEIENPARNAPIDDAELDKSLNQSPEGITKVQPMPWENVAQHFGVRSPSPDVQSALQDPSHELPNEPQDAQPNTEANAQVPEAPTQEQMPEGTGRMGAQGFSALRDQLILKKFWKGIWEKITWENTKTLGKMVIPTGLIGAGAYALGSVHWLQQSLQLGMGLGTVGLLLSPALAGAAVHMIPGSNKMLSVGTSVASAIGLAISAGSALPIISGGLGVAAILYFAKQKEPATPEGAAGN